jgi:hypothetical protein
MYFIEYISAWVATETDACILQPLPVNSDHKIRKRTEYLCSRHLYILH